MTLESPKCGNISSKNATVNTPIRKGGYQLLWGGQLSRRGAHLSRRGANLSRRGVFLSEPLFVSCI